jgi:hypothetical protein
MHEINSRLEEIELLDAISYLNFTVYPLRGPAASSRPYRTLDEALAAKEARVTELDEAGVVSALRFENNGVEPVLLVDGEELVGAKQNRILNLTILAPAAAEITIPVSCVEAGRWGWRSRHFSTAPHAHYASGRAAKMADVTASIRLRSEARSDQGAVWSNIAAKMERMGYSSATGAISDVFEGSSESVEGYATAIELPRDSLGAVFALDGRVLGLELFEDPKVFRHLAPKLLRSWALDALERGEAAAEVTAPPRSEAQRFVASLGHAETLVKPAIGLGKDVRLSSQGVIGAGLVVEDRLVHLAAYAAEASEQASRQDAWAM